MDRYKEIYEELKDIPQVRFKDSMAMNLRLPTVHEMLS